MHQYREFLSQLREEKRSRDRYFRMRTGQKRAKLTEQSGKIAPKNIAILRGEFFFSRASFSENDVT
jgi:hypothetical protein